MLCNVRLLIPSRHRLNNARDNPSSKDRYQMEIHQSATRPRLRGWCRSDLNKSRTDAKETDKLTEAAQRVGLNISKSKTRILKISCKNNNSIKFQNGQDIQEINDFTYLGACGVSADGAADKEVEGRLCKAKTAFRKLREVWSSKQYSKKTEIKVFNILVRRVLLYGSQTWKTNAKDYEKLDSSQ